MLKPRLCSQSLSRGFTLHNAFRISLGSKRNLSTSSAFSSAAERPTSVAVVGGGITGLTTAFYLSKLSPTLPITLYEASDRFGGWINSQLTPLDDGELLFEAGPRTLRLHTTESLVTLDLIRQLGLTDEVVCISKNAPAATNRYIYYPNRLNQIPNSPLAAWKSLFDPIMEGVIWGILKEPFIKPRSPDVEDESIGDFMVRRCGRKVTENVSSAVWHGIYAGDLYKLSARSLAPAVWRGELKYGSIYKFGKALFDGEGEKRLDDQILTDQLVHLNRWLLMEMESVMAITFKKGLETLSSALVKELKNSKNVTIKVKTPVNLISFDESNRETPVKIEFFDDLAPAHFSHAVSTLLAPTTSALLPEQISPLSAVEAVTVGVVNLYFARQNLTPVRGFGYLIPISVSPENNPEKALGVIFDSEVVPQDPSREQRAKGTNLTVMLGGHYWDGEEPPKEDDLLMAAQSVVKDHLGITDAPLIEMCTLQNNCIPQPTVGHHQRMQQAHGELKKLFHGRLAVAGSSYRGVGVNDCIRSAYDVAHNLWRGGDEGGWTGLETFVNEKWVPTAKPSR